MKSHVSKPRPGMGVLPVEDDHTFGPAGGDVEFHHLDRSLQGIAKTRSGSIEYPQAALAVGNDAVDVDERGAGILTLGPRVPSIGRKRFEAIVRQDFDDARRRAAGSQCSFLPPDLQSRCIRAQPRRTAADHLFQTAAAAAFEAAFPDDAYPPPEPGQRLLAGRVDNPVSRDFC